MPTTLSKRTNEYRWREKQLPQLPLLGERRNFLSAEEFDQLPTVPWFDVQGRVIPNHPDLPHDLQNLEPEAPNLVRRILRQKQRANKRAKQAEALATPLPPLPPLESQVHPSFYPDYPEDWIDVTEEASEDYLLPTHVANVPSQTIYSVTGTNPTTLVNAPSGIRHSVMALQDINTKLHEHTNTVHGPGPGPKSRCPRASNQKASNEQRHKQ